MSSKAKPVSKGSVSKPGKPTAAKPESKTAVSSPTKTPAADVLAALDDANLQAAVESLLEKERKLAELEILARLPPHLRPSLIGDVNATVAFDDISTPFPPSTSPKSAHRTPFEGVMTASGVIDTDNSLAATSRLLGEVPEVPFEVPFDPNPNELMAPPLSSLVRSSELPLPTAAQLLLTAPFPATGYGPGPSANPRTGLDLSRAGLSDAQAEKLGSLATLTKRTTEDSLIKTTGAVGQTGALPTAAVVQPIGLRCLDLSWNDFGPRSAPVMLDVIKRYATTLNCLALDGNHFGVPGLSAIYTLAVKCPAMVHLGFSWIETKPTAVSEAPVPDKTAAMSKDKSRSASATRQRQPAVPAVGGSDLPAGTVDHLIAQLVSAPQLRSLSLAGSSFCRKSFGQLLNALDKNAVNEPVDADAEIPSKSRPTSRTPARAQTPASKSKAAGQTASTKITPPTLLSLDLSRSFSIDAFVVNDLVNALSKSRILKLPPASATALRVDIQPNTLSQLRVLDLSFCGLSTLALEPLLRVVASEVTTLVTLLLRGNKLDDEGAHLLASTIKANSRRLRHAHTETIESDTVRQISSVKPAQLPPPPAFVSPLRVIDVRDNPLYFSATPGATPGCDELVNALVECGNLLTLCGPAPSKESFLNWAGGTIYKPTIADALPVTQGWGPSSLVDICAIREAARVVMCGHGPGDGVPPTLQIPPKQAEFAAAITMYRCDCMQIGSYFATSDKSLISPSLLLSLPSLWEHNFGVLKHVQAVPARLADWERNIDELRAFSKRVYCSDMTILDCSNIVGLDFGEEVLRFTPPTLPSGGSFLDLQVGFQAKFDGNISASTLSTFALVICLRHRALEGYINLLAASSTSFASRDRLHARALNAGGALLGGKASNSLRASTADESWHHADALTTPAVTVVEGGARGVGTNARWPSAWYSFQLPAWLTSCEDVDEFDITVRLATTADGLKEPLPQSVDVCLHTVELRSLVVDEELLRKRMDTTPKLGRDYRLLDTTSWART